MTIEEVVREEFEKEGIGVTIIEDGFLANTCIIDTSKHDKKIRANAIDELSDLIDRLLWNYDNETYKDLSECFKESARLLKEQENGKE